MLKKRLTKTTITAYEYKKAKMQAKKNLFRKVWEGSKNYKLWKEKNCAGEHLSNKGVCV